MASASQSPGSDGPLLLLAGPTAVGKSEISLVLAEHVNGEIVCVDSMQVYRGLDIGTAKPSISDRARVPHHLIDILSIQEQFDAACFVQLAGTAIAEIRSRGRIPILCGGTGLYFKALLEGLGDSPPADPVLRKQLEQTPMADLLAELERTDSETFLKIDRQNPRRVVRAVEVIRLTGRPFSQQRARWETQSTVHGPQSTVRSPESTVGGPQATGHGGWFAFYGMIRGVAELNRRIEERVDLMFATGLVEETEQLLRLGLSENQTASQAIGYRQVIEYLRGVRSLVQTVELVKIRTRQFAKRQRTWFRRQRSISWVHFGPEDSVASMATLLEQDWKKRVSSSSESAR